MGSARAKSCSIVFVFTEPISVCAPTWATCTLDLYKMYKRQLHGKLCLEGVASVAVLQAVVLDLQHSNAEVD